MNIIKAILSVILGLFDKTGSPSPTGSCSPDKPLTKKQ